MARFEYLNVSPDKSKHRNDCVTRAISLASGLPYSSVRRKLFHTARLLGCMKLCVSCYIFLIDNVLKCTPKNCDYMSVEQFADLHPIGIYIVRIEGHLTTIIDNVIYDIWDCRNRLCTNAWEVR